MQRGRLGYSTALSKSPYTIGNRVRGNPSRVQIPPSPPVCIAVQSRRPQEGCTVKQVQMTLKDEIVEFLLDREARGLSDFTLQFYRQQLAHLPPWPSLTSVTPTDIREALIRHGKTHSPGGVHALYRALRACIRWYSQEYDLPNPRSKVPPPKVPQALLDPVELTTVRKMLQTCPHTFHGERDKAILLFLLDTGVRRSELLALQKRDVDMTGSVLVRQGKGGKARTVFLSAKTRKQLLKYLRYNDTPYLWIDDASEPLSSSALQAILRRRAQQAHVPVPTPHMFRRAFALQSLRNGVDLVSIQRMLGHSSLAIVSRYLKQVDEDLRVAHKRAAPVDSL